MISTVRISQKIVPMTKLKSTTTRTPTSTYPTTVASTDRAALGCVDIPGVCQPISSFGGRTGFSDPVGVIVVALAQVEPRLTVERTQDVTSWQRSRGRVEMLRTHDGGRNLAWRCFDRISIVCHVAPILYRTNYSPDHANTRVSLGSNHRNENIV
jgi:hypothetical protein